MKSFKDYLLAEEQANETPSVGDIFEFEIARDETLIETTIIDVLEDGVVLNADETAWNIFESNGYLTEYWSGLDAAGIGGGTKSPVGSRQPKKPQIKEGFMPNEFEDEFVMFTNGGPNKVIKYHAVIDDDDNVHVDQCSDPDYMEYCQQHAETVWAERDAEYPAMDEALNEGKIKAMLLDIEELTDEEFEAEYGMSKAEAKEKFNLDEAEYRGRKVPLGKPMRGDVKKFKVYVKDPKTGNVKKVNFGHGGTSAKKAGQKTMKIKKSNPKRRKSFRARHNCDNPGPRTKARYWSCRAW